MLQREGEVHTLPSRRSAFSMVELIFVLVIIAVISAIAAPRYSAAISEQHVDAAVRRIETDLALAQRRAKTSSASRMVSFDIAQDFYQVFGIEDPDHPGQPYIVDLSEPPYEATIVTANFGGLTDLTYDGYGAPDNNGTIVIKVGSRYRRINLDGSGKTAVIIEGAPVIPEIPETPK